MDEDLKRLFVASGVPHELEAQRRAWTVVRKAYAEREPLPRRRTLRPLLAAAAVAAVLAAAVSPPGRALGDWIRDTVRGQDSARPALFRLPTGGRLLVESARGPWVVQPDGSKRLLGRYAGAGFSPRGLFLVVTSGRRVVAVEPDGDPRWTVTRPQKVGDARWAPGGLVVAYRAGGSLRVVDGDGTDDRVLARRVAPVPPAWRPRVDADAVAYVDGRSRVRLVETGSRRPVWTSRPLRRIRELVWSPDGSSVLVVGTGARQTILDARGRVARVLELPDGHGLVDASFAPDGRALAYTRFERESGRGA
ncbi:MAG TPA: hypothetical protein VHF23_10590, partial [Gaiellaceae bacterium]|nr:hypothetical protein [Gaiellaceae bacterium]